MKGESIYKEGKGRERERERDEGEGSVATTDTHASIHTPFPYCTYIHAMKNQQTLAELGEVTSNMLCPTFHNV